MCVVQPADADLDRLERFDAWLQESFRPQALKTVDGIRNLGQLRDEKCQDRMIAHASSELEVCEFVFEGLTIHAVVEKSALPRVWITAISISSPAWALENGLAVGQSTAELELLPVLPEVGSSRFCGVNNCLVAEEHNGVISRLSLDIYLD